jgi:hypothetical protein
MEAFKRTRRLFATFICVYFNGVWYVKSVRPLPTITVGTLLLMPPGYYLEIYSNLIYSRIELRDCKDNTALLQNHFQRFRWADCLGERIWTLCVWANSLATNLPAGLFFPSMWCTVLWHSLDFLFTGVLGLCVPACVRVCACACACVRACVCTYSASLIRTYVCLWHQFPFISFLFSYSSSSICQ